ncbi:hypothetical protein KKA95_04050 [Patescibacteria group bacterium]|nr:hypothetical protein [Patescibacteria group bacterium]
MKYISNIIKGIILSLLFASTLALNLNETVTVMVKPDVNKNIEVAQEIKNYSFIPQAYAAEGDATAPQEAFDPSKLIDKVAEMATYVHKLFHPLINFFSFNIGNFLGTDYIYADAMGKMLKNIWTVSRNLVNIIFVLILLGLALKEIFWINDEGSQLKKNLIKFTLLLVAVNFSWLGTKVVLDAANVATNVVFAIPMGVSTAANDIEFTPCTVNPDGKSYTGMCYPDTILSPTESDSGEYKYMNAQACKDGNVEAKFDAIYNTKKEGDDFVVDTTADGYEEYGKTPTSVICWDNLSLTKYNKNTSVIYLTYGMARIQNLVESSNSGTKITQLAVGILFSLLIQVAFTISLLALFIAMIIRMAVLWVFVAFSPFLVLLLFSEKFGEGIADKFSVKAFAKWAFVPVKVGAVFAVSFLMVSAGQSIMGKDATFFEKLDKGGIEITTKMYKIKSLFMGMDTIQEFIWLLIALVVLWAGVFAVLGEMPIVKGITDKINDYGTSTAKWLAKSPYWAPIMPMVDKEGNFKLGSYEKEYGLALNIPEVMRRYRQDIITGGNYADMDRKAKAIRANTNEQDKIKTWAGVNGAAGIDGAAIAGAYGISPHDALEMKRAFKEAIKTSGLEEHEADIVRAVEDAARKNKGTTPPGTVPPPTGETPPPPVTPAPGGPAPGGPAPGGPAPGGPAPGGPAPGGGTTGGTGGV